MQHDLKCWPVFFEKILTGEKRHEIRLNDRNFQVGDILQLREWDPITKRHTGRAVLREVTYITPSPSIGLLPGYVAMSIRTPVRP
jgi:hypothetical protein